MQIFILLIVLSLVAGSPREALKPSLECVDTCSCIEELDYLRTIDVSGCTINVHHCREFSAELDPGVIELNNLLEDAQLVYNYRLMEEKQLVTPDNLDSKAQEIAQYMTNTLVYNTCNDKEKNVIVQSNSLSSKPIEVDCGEGGKLVTSMIDAYEYAANRVRYMYINEHLVDKAYTYTITTPSEKILPTDVCYPFIDYTNINRYHCLYYKYTTKRGECRSCWIRVMRSNERVLSNTVNRCSEISSLDIFNVDRIKQELNNSVAPELIYTTVDTVNTGSTIKPGLISVLLGILFMLF